MEIIYVLVETEPGSLENVLKKIRTKKNVIEAHAVTGPFDIIVKVEGKHIADALGIVVRELRKIKGIKSTETLVCVKI
jgi:DNA-binding Lrp family transcriptional regulator